MHLSAGLRTDSFPSQNKNIGILILRVSSLKLEWIWAYQQQHGGHYFGHHLFSIENKIRPAIVGQSNFVNVLFHSFLCFSIFVHGCSMRFNALSLLFNVFGMLSNDCLMILLCLFHAFQFFFNLSQIFSMLFNAFLYFSTFVQSF